MNTRRSPGRWATGACCLFFAILTVAALTGQLPWPIIWLYAATSLVTFVTYRIDKSAACQGSRRTPESTLHLLALMGGWPGAWIAQQHLRHKSAKISFQLVFRATVLLNCGALGLLSTPAGTLRSMLAIV